MPSQPSSYPPAENEELWNLESGFNSLEEEKEDGEEEGEEEERGEEEEEGRGGGEGGGKRLSV